MIVGRLRKTLEGYWEEIEPILKHGIVAGVAVVVSAGLIWLFEVTLPKTTAKHLMTIDHVFGIGVLLLFSTNTLALLGIRLFRNLRHELEKKTPDPAAGESEP